MNLKTLAQTKDNIKIDIKETESKRLYWIQLAQDKVPWRAFVNTVMNP